nr:MAG TPA: hypothetical protein [Caudoviricetes sp.]
MGRFHRIAGVWYRSRFYHSATHSRCGGHPPAIAYYWMCVQHGIQLRTHLKL